MNNLKRHLIIFSFISMCLVLCGCGMSIDEKELYEIKAPDNSFKLIVTQTWQGVPYGVRGHVYITDWDRNDRRYVDSYFEDFDDDLVVEKRIVWDEQSKSFRWRKHSVNLKTFPLSGNQGQE